MQITESSLPGVLLIQPKTFADDRGFFLETFQNSRYQEMGIAKPFVQDNLSRSHKGVLRGLHYQLPHPQGKLVYVVRGKVLDVVVDIRAGSPTFGHSISHELSDENHLQIYVPEGFAHGFVTMSDTVDFIYKCTDYYNPSCEKGVLWNDSRLNINWQIDNPLLSPKDLQHKCLQDIPKEILPKYSE